MVKIDDSNNIILKEIFEEYSQYQKRGFTPCYTSDSIFNILQYYKMWECNKELSRIKCDGDARYFNSLKGDTMISFWTPYTLALKFTTGKTYYKSTALIDELIEKRNSPGYKEINERFGEFAGLSHTPGNFILLPDDGPDNAMNINRYKYSQDRIDKSLMECFPQGKLSRYFRNDEERLRKWVDGQNLGLLFKGAIIKDNIKPLNENNPFVGYSEMNESELYEFVRNAVELIKKRAEDAFKKLKQNALILEDTLKSFGIQAHIINICSGPAVTQYELQPTAGLGIGAIADCVDDVSRYLERTLVCGKINIEAPTPNKPTISIDVPNGILAGVEPVSAKGSGKANFGEIGDEFFQQAVECVAKTGMASTAQLQRHLNIGYAQAARIIGQLEERGIVGPFKGDEPRQVLIAVNSQVESEPAVEKSEPAPIVKYANEFAVKHIKGGYAIKKYIGNDKFSTAEIVIPETINGEPVIMLGNEALHALTSLKEVTIPNSITHIGAYAFAKCTSLESISIPNGVIKIGKLAFVGCTRLKTVNIHACKKNISIARNAFSMYTTVNFLGA